MDAWAAVPTCLPPSFRPTGHLRWRMSCRHIPTEAVVAALLYGRVTASRGAEVFTIGRQEVRYYAWEGIDLSAFEGVHVVCTPDGKILTAYRGRALRRARRRSR